MVEALNTWNVWLLFLFRTKWNADEWNATLTPTWEGASGKKNELLLWLLPTQKLDLACSSTKLTSQGRATMSLCFRKELTITNTNLINSFVVKWLLFFCYSCQLWRCNVLVFCQSMDCGVLVAMGYSWHNSPDYADRYNEISTRMFLGGIMTMVVESLCSAEFGSSEL